MEYMAELALKMNEENPRNAFAFLGLINFSKNDID
jgi:hypothetical protein